MAPLKFIEVPNLELKYHAYQRFVLKCLDSSPRIHGDVLEKETEPWNI